MMAENLPWWLNFHPHNPGDPGPEVYKFLSELPVEQQGPIVAVISAARGELEAVRAKGFAQIGAAVAASGRGNVAKR
jgi:hypothetical protein